MSDIDLKVVEIETSSLETHVAMNHQRFAQLDKSIGRLEALIEKGAGETKEQINELKKIVVWASSTLFGTLLIALLTSVFKVI
jgi:peptidoglycan hydrolase CwlO-like protein